VPVPVRFLQLVAESDGFEIGEAHCCVTDLHARGVGWEREMSVGRVEFVVSRNRLNGDRRWHCPFSRVSCWIEPHDSVALCEPQAPIRAFESGRKRAQLGCNTWKSPAAAEVLALDPIV
jgi:hypothetical protein